MTDEEFTKEQMDEQRKEVSRLRSELKAFNKARAAMSKEDKERTRQQAILDIKRKFGKNALLKGIDLMPQATQRERNAQIGGHKSGEPL
jgi:hypothetical protein